MDGVMKVHLSSLPQSEADSGDLGGSLATNLFTHENGRWYVAIHCPSSAQHDRKVLRCVASEFSSSMVNAQTDLLPEQEQNIQTLPNSSCERSTTDTGARV